MRGADERDIPKYINMLTELGIEFPAEYGDTITHANQQTDLINQS